MYKVKYLKSNSFDTLHKDFIRKKREEVCDRVVRDGVDIDAVRVGGAVAATALGVLGVGLNILGSL